MLQVITFAHLRLVAKNEINCGRRLLEFAKIKLKIPKLVYCGVKIEDFMYKSNDPTCTLFDNFIALDIQLTFRKLCIKKVYHNNLLSEKLFKLQISNLVLARFIIWCNYLEKQYSKRPNGIQRGQSGIQGGQVVFQEVKWYSRRSSGILGGQVVSQEVKGYQRRSSGMLLGQVGLQEVKGYSKG